MVSSKNFTLIGAQGRGRLDPRRKGTLMLISMSSNALKELLNIT